MEFNATFIASAISFIVFTLIMNAIFYKPLSNAVSQRQKFVADTLEEAKSNTQKSETILKDKERKIEKTKHQARQIISEKAEEVKTQKAGLTSQAQQKASEKIEEAKAVLNKSSDEAQAVLSEEAKKLAESITSKILS